MIVCCSFREQLWVIDVRCWSSILAIGESCLYHIDIFERNFALMRISEVYVTFDS